MEETKLLETAQMMYLQNKGRRDVINFLLSNGIAKDRVDALATQAYKSIRSQRMEMMEEQEEITQEEINKNVIIGGLILAAGIIATMTTDRIWYGAMIVGVLTMISGRKRG